MRLSVPAFFLLLLLAKTGFARSSDDCGLNTAPRYVSIEITDNKVFAVSDSGQVAVWDLNTLELLPFAGNNPSFRFMAIGKDRNNQIFLGTNKGDVFKVDPQTLSCSLFLHVKYPVYAICFNAKNQPFLVIPYAVYDPLGKKYWNDFKHGKNGINARKKVLGLYWKKTDRYFMMPQITYIDDQDRIWMMNSFGEFGGTIQLFDAKKRKILSSQFEGLDMALFFPQSVFNDADGNIYITSGLQHFGNSGAIYKLDRNGHIKEIFSSPGDLDSTANKSGHAELFIGPGAFNKNDHSLYFASSDGFYRAPAPDTGNIRELERVFNPTLNWAAEPLAIGVGMAIKQVKFTPDNKLVFLTSLNGIGVYDNGKLLFLK